MITEYVQGSAKNRLLWYYIIEAGLERHAVYLKSIADEEADKANAASELANAAEEKANTARELANAATAKATAARERSESAHAAADASAAKAKNCGESKER